MANVNLDKFSSIIVSGGGGGSGDMILASIQTVTGAKTFNDTKLLLRNVADTFDGSFVNSNTADRIYTLQDAAGTLAFLADITGTNSGTNTGDQTSIVGITGTKAEFDTAVSDGDIVYVGDQVTDLKGGNWKIFYTNGSGVIIELALGTSGQFLKSNGVASAPTFDTPAGSGDMVLADVQTVTGAKTFEDTTLLLRNVADTFNGSFLNTNTADRVYTLQDAAGTLAFLSDVTGDMVLASVQTVTGAKTFEDTKLLLRNVADTFDGSFVNTNTADRIYTLQDAAGTLAFLSDITTPSLTKDITIETPTASEDMTIFRTDVAITVQEVIAVSTGTTPSTTYILKHHTDRSNAGNDLTTSGATTSTTTGDTASLSDATIPADSFIWIETTAASGTSVILSVDIRFTED